MTDFHCSFSFLCDAVPEILGWINKRLKTIFIAAYRIENTLARVTSKIPVTTFKKNISKNCSIWRKDIHMIWGLKKILSSEERPE